MKDEIPLNPLDKVSEQLKFIDNKEYQGRFLLTPDLQDDADYRHIDKNSVITNLRQRIKGEIDEVGTARSILRARHILNNPHHYKTIKKKILIGHTEQIQEDGSTLLTPVFEENESEASNFPLTSHMLSAKYYSFVITASARNGERLNKSISNRLEKEETLVDKTEVKSKWNTKDRKDQQT